MPVSELVNLRRLGDLAAPGAVTGPRPAGKDGEVHHAPAGIGSLQWAGLGLGPGTGLQHGRDAGVRELIDAGERHGASA